MSNTHKKPVIVYDKDNNVIAEYSSIKDASEAFKCSHTTMIYRISAGREFNGLLFKLANPNETTMPLTRFLSKKEYTFDDAINTDKFTIIEYKTVNNVCITPCPFKPAPRPMVGNGKCVRCTAFRGKNKTNHQVACSFRKYKT